MFSNPSISATSLLKVVNLYSSLLAMPSSFGSMLSIVAVVLFHLCPSKRPSLLTFFMTFSTKGVIRSVTILSRVAANSIFFSLRPRFKSWFCLAMSSSAIRHKRDAFSESDSMSNVSS